MNQRDQTNQTFATRSEIERMWNIRGEAQKQIDAMRGIRADFQVEQSEKIPDLFVFLCCERDWRS
jgi:hypothetical protein